MSYFEDAFKIVIGHEGGLSMDPQDRGNWTSGVIGKGQLKGTKYGISAAAYPDIDIKALTLNYAHWVYKRDYWDRIYADFLPPALAIAAFDTAVNSGVTKSREFLLQTHEAINYLDLRQTYVDQLARNPQYAKYKKGWTNRIEKLRTQVLPYVGIPAILEFSYPVLPYSLYTVWDGCYFLDPQYLASEKSQHTGTDYNARTGGDTDRGHRVYNIADGTVIEVAHYPVIGNAVHVKHTDDLYSVYWHLQDVFVKEGDVVTGRQGLGTIGKGAGGKFWAHLHFELRKELLPLDQWPSLTMSHKQAYDYISRTRYNSDTFFKIVKANQKKPDMLIIKGVQDIPALPLSK